MIMILCPLKYIKSTYLHCVMMTLNHLCELKYSYQLYHYLFYHKKPKLSIWDCLVYYICTQKKKETKAGTPPQSIFEFCICILLYKRCRLSSHQWLKADNSRPLHLQDWLWIIFTLKDTFKRVYWKYEKNQLIVSSLKTFYVDYMALKSSILTTKMTVQLSEPLSSSDACLAHTEFAKSMCANVHYLWLQICKIYQSSLKSQCT